MCYGFILQGKFLFYRNQVGDEFMGKVLDGMGFNTFVNERGPPYRICDIFDRVSNTINGSWMYVFVQYI